MQTIGSVKALEDCIGVAGTPVKMKIIDHLDATAASWIAASPFLFLGLGGPDGPTATAAGGPAGFASVTTKGVSIPLDAIDDPGALAVGVGAGLLFLAPGIGETLRANGRIAALGERHVEIAVEECFVHCAKALIRSDFWAGGEAQAPEDPAAFLDASRFLALVTMDGSGQIDVSPKGDPAGLLVRMRDGRATLAERPGNRLAFGYRNIIEQPKVAALALAPGCNRTAVLRGRAALTADETVRGAFVVDGRTPILATVIEADSLQTTLSAALERSGLWSGLPAADIDPAGALVAHIKLNRIEGVEATMLRLAIKRDLVHGGLQSNYRTDLY
ncbi:MAG: pyridoxamine 5'-phosphate oxidase family protein [Caulobacter sp.]|nr:pyridoxamine 5'-phosphate oxidase family protein [Caulobacter sp.]